MNDLLQPFIQLRHFMDERYIGNFLAVKVCPYHISALKDQLLHRGLTYHEESRRLRAVLGFDIIQVGDRGECMLCLAKL